MPIYEYKCKRCQAKFELLVNLNKVKNPVSCPHCQSSKVERLISNFAFSGKERRVIGKNCGACTASDCSSCK